MEKQKQERSGELVMLLSERTSKAGRVYYNVMKLVDGKMKACTHKGKDIKGHPYKNDKSQGIVLIAHDNTQYDFGKVEL